jgi:hypothetical protein
LPSSPPRQQNVLHVGARAAPATGNPVDMITIVTAR